MSANATNVAAANFKRLVDVILLRDRVRSRPLSPEGSTRALPGFDRLRLDGDQAPDRGHGHWWVARQTPLSILGYPAVVICLLTSATAWSEKTMQPDGIKTRNGLLRALPADSQKSVEPHLQTMFLKRGEPLAIPGTSISHVYFFEHAVASAMAVSRDGHQTESAIIGCEGMSATALVHDTDRTPNLVIVQIKGDSLRMEADTFQMLMAQDPVFAILMRHFAQTLEVQIAQTALSNACHGVDKRLARWLLMVHDRIEEDQMLLTHGFLSVVLAVRRPTITTTLHSLEAKRFIRAYRGRIVMRDRRGLEAFAHDAYGVPEAEYLRLVGPLPRDGAEAAHPSAGSGRASELTA